VGLEARRGGALTNRGSATTCPGSSNGNDAALVWAARPERPVAPRWRTADWAYIRWHEGTADPKPCYRVETLADGPATCAPRGRQDEDVWAFFNNDPGRCAITDAPAFAELWASAAVRR